MYTCPTRDEVGVWSCHWGAGVINVITGYMSVLMNNQLTMPNGDRATNFQMTLLWMFSKF